MADFTIKRGDRYPSISTTLTHSDGSGGLSTATSAKFIMRQQYANSAKVNATVSNLAVTDTALSVRYDWAAGDTELVGDYNAEWEVTFADGKIETFPNDGYDTVKVYQDLG